MKREAAVGAPFEDGGNPLSPYQVRGRLQMKNDLKNDLAKCARSVHEPMFYASPSGRGLHAVAGEGKRCYRCRISLISDFFLG